MRRSLLIPAVIILILCATALQAAPAEPAITIDAPPTGATINGSQDIVVGFTSTDDLPVTKVQVFLDGKSITQLEYESPVANGTSRFRWDTIRTPNGKHKVDVQAFSGTEYLGMASCTVTVNNQAPDLTIPRVAILSPSEGQVVSGIVPIAIEASDDSGAEPMVTVYVDKSMQSMKNRGPYTYQWDTTRHENGPHYIGVKAADEANNTAEVTPVRVIVRNPVTQLPITVRSEGEAATAGDTSGTTLVLPDLPSIGATPREDANNAGLEEHPRTATQPVEGFEVPGEPSAAAGPEIHAGDSPAPAATSMPEPASTPTLVARLSSVDLSASMRSDYRLAVPADPDKSVASEPAKSVVREYVLQSGDCIIKLAKRFGVTVEALIAANGLEDPELIRAGDVLLIPADIELIPLRPVFERASGTVLWDQNEKVVRAVCPQYDVKLRPGSTEAVVNDAGVTMDSPAVVRSGRTMVSETFVSGTLGLSLGD